jgi:hypothetical protein
VVKRPGRGVNHPHSSSAEVKKRVELYLYFPCLFQDEIYLLFYEHNYSETTSGIYTHRSDNNIILDLREVACKVEC